MLWFPHYSLPAGTHLSQCQFLQIFLHFLSPTLTISLLISPVVLSISIPTSDLLLTESDLNRKSQHLLSRTIWPNAKHNSLTQLAQIFETSHVQNISIPEIPSLSISYKFRPSHPQILPKFLTSQSRTICPKFRPPLRRSRASDLDFSRNDRQPMSPRRGDNYAVFQSGHHDSKSISPQKQSIIVPGHLRPGGNSRY